MTRGFQIVFALLIVIFGVAFHIKNGLPVTLNFYVQSVEVPLSWVVVTAFSVGAILGLVVMLNTILRLHREIRRLTKKHEMATKEIVNLRAIPISDVP